MRTAEAGGGWKGARVLADQLVLLTYPLGRSLNILAVLGLMVLWYLTPGDQCLVRSDLVPWAALCASVTVALQGGRVGQGPHPQLTVLSTRQGQGALRIAAALIPQALYRIYDLGAALQGTSTSCADPSASLATTFHLPAASARIWGDALLAGLLWCAIAALRWVGRAEGQSAWVPRHPHRGLHAAVRIGVLLLSVGGMVALGARVPYTDSPSLIAAGLLASAGFVLTGWLWERDQDVAQRAVLRERARNAGHRVDTSVSAAAWAVAIAAPAAGLVVLELLTKRDLGPREGVVAAGIALYLCAAGMVVWPARRLLGWALQLHEIVPLGEATPTSSSDPGADTTPPTGTLRFNPQRVARVGISIPWLVPLDQLARSSGVYSEEPLWLEPDISPLRHVLGPATVPTNAGWPAARRVEIAVLPGDDLAPLVVGDNQERRLVIYTPDPVDLTRREVRAAGANARLQEVDPSTAYVVLTDGAVLILGSGLVSYLYEVEFCAPLYEGDTFPDDALPQFQDQEAP